MQRSMLFAVLIVTSATGIALAEKKTKPGTPERSAQCEFDKQSCELIGDDLYLGKDMNKLRAWYQDCFDAYEYCLVKDRTAGKGSVGGPGSTVRDPGNAGRNVKPFSRAKSFAQD
ncbi:hypothetical protein FQ775_06270 [Nitratireductor mangrovi]|uniref:DUF3551 domain-containing protein n=1 Tax=Nitratireductor mangrovi TaxID=2599600 RepID=A0A5B8KWN9_9HYPH|nr:hypothetical protein [Nitratireductor mangrovi]QDZ00015.1 hypothetical protein FQ775_06270 [Nitratireductor mangrovi]